MQPTLTAIVLLWSVSAAFAQVLPSLGSFEDDDASPASVTDRVAAALGNPPALQFRKVRRLSPEGSHEEKYCGQFLGSQKDFELFVYTKSPERDLLRVLSAIELNGMRNGRKMIAMLKRVGCL